MLSFQQNLQIFKRLRPLFLCVKKSAAAGLNEKDPQVRITLPSGCLKNNFGCFQKSFFSLSRLFYVCLINQTDMIKFLKFIAISTIVSLDITLAETWYRVFLSGGYFNNASFVATAMIGVILPAAVIYFSYQVIRLILKYK